MELGAPLPFALEGGRLRLQLGGRAFQFSLEVVDSSRGRDGFSSRNGRVFSGGAAALRVVAGARGAGVLLLGSGGGGGIVGGARPVATAWVVGLGGGGSGGGGEAFPQLVRLQAQIRRDALALGAPC